MSYKRKKIKLEEWTLPLALGAACLMAMIILVVLFFSPKKVESEPLPFEKPPFEQSAIQGTPEPPESAGYQLFYQEGAEFKAGLCGRLQFEDDAAEVYFTNPKENTVYLKLRIFDEEEEMIAETGLIKPGEYLKNITLQEVPDSGDNIKMKVMTYDPETYTSVGSYTMATTIQ